MEPTGVNKILVEKYGYEWVNGKAWRPGTAPEPEISTIDVTLGPLPDWITPPPADAFVTQALETLTNPVTGEKFTVPTGGYTVNVSAPTPIQDTSPAPNLPVATPEPEPSEPVSLEEKIEQLQASLSELQKKYEEALQDYIKALGIDHVAVAGPGLGTIILNYKFKSSSVRERAIYLNEQLQLPEEERVLSIKELDEGQVMHKPGKL